MGASQQKSGKAAKVSPKSAPKASPKAAPKASPKSSPKVAPKASPKAAPKASPKVAPKKVSSPKSSPKIAPKTPSSDKKFGKNPQDDYQNNIVKYLKANGPSNLANMGSAVKKPAGEPKIKVFAKARPATFKLTGDIISLVK